jgi:hypothetical protein
MLEASGGNWQTGDWERPLGRGINFQILVESLQPLIDALAGASGRCSVRRMTPGIGSVTKREACANFSCRTPDGYLLRFAQPLGRRPISGVAKIRALFETTFFAGLRKAGIPEE